jgi:hypothetical protein
MTVNSINKAAIKIRSLIQGGISGTHYFTLELNEKQYQIRVSDHSGRSANNRFDFEDFFSFVTNKNAQDCKISNEFLLDADGDFTEEFTSIEECLDWHIN